MNLLTGKKGMLNPQSVIDAAKGKVIYVDVNELRNNELNRFEIQDIAELAENIHENGLLEPLQGIKASDGSVVLLSGHRRYAAIMRLLEQGDEVSYAGKVLDRELPVILMQENDPLEQRALILSYNAYRTMTKEERKKIILEAHDIYKESCAVGRRPEGREREWITAMTGISDGTVGKVLAELKRKVESERYEEKDSTSDAVTKSNEDFKKVSKAFRKAADTIPLAIDMINEGMDSIDYRELKDLIGSLKVDLEKVIPDLPEAEEADFLRIFLIQENEIRQFAENGDRESVSELLKEKNSSHSGQSGDQYSWNLSGGKFHFCDRDNQMEITIPISRFTNMLIERSKCLRGS